MTIPDRCEWDPELAVAAGLDSGCQRPAAVIVGADGQWRLCSECAALPTFKRFKRRKTIVRIDKPVRDPLMDAPMPTEWPTKAEIEDFAAENRAAREAMLAAVDGRAVDFDCDVAGVVPGCIACAVQGPEHCTADNLPPEVHTACEAEARRLHVLRAGAPCHDCAFLRDSDETRGEVTERLARQADPFHCHQAMPLDGKGRVPADGDFKPRDHSAYPVCAGWAAARAVLRGRVLAARAAGKLWRSKVRPPTMRERKASKRSDA